jgi:hypothetical protein
MDSILIIVLLIVVKRMLVALFPVVPLSRTSRLERKIGTNVRRTDEIVLLTFLPFFFQQQFSGIMERIINKNPRLYGPGPVRRTPNMYYSRMPALRGFAMCATHAIAIGFATSCVYKFTMGDPSTRAIEEYYKENPPK